MKHWQVPESQSGLTLQAFLKSQLENTSVKSIKRAIDSGRCLLNGRIERFSSHRIGSGDRVELSMPEKNAIEVDPIESILYADEHLVAYNKPPGVTSDGKELKKQFPSLILLHRLDKDTSGILLFARSESFAEKMEKLFKQRQVQKIYLAVVDGVPENTSGVIENFLGKLFVYQGQTVWGAVPQEKGRFARTAWQLLKAGNDASVLECYPETGRTHQIRVHLSEMGHPILGDHQYGKSFVSGYRPRRMLLHAAELTIVHPVSFRKITIRAPIPQELNEAINWVMGSNG